MTKIKLGLHNIYNKGQAIEKEIDRVMEPHGLTPVAPIGTPPWGDIPNALSSTDLHLGFSRGGIKEAVQKKILLAEIIPGKGSGQLKKHVLRILAKPGDNKYYHRIEKDDKNLGRIFVHFRYHG